ncbi:MAG: protein kinase [Proteobacteria bacterium]|nr:protein kinase [Pseudomonadota bacterium]
MIPVVCVLVCAHHMEIVHRDLKPENVMLTESGTIKGTDFDIAKLLAEHMDNSLEDTETLASPIPSGATRPGASGLSVSVQNLVSGLVSDWT